MRRVSFERIFVLFEGLQLNGPWTWVEGKQHLTEVWLICCPDKCHLGDVDLLFVSGLLGFGRRLSSFA